MSGLLLGDKEMAHWFDTRPVFVRAAVTDDFREGTADYTALSERIATTRIEDAHKLVASEADLEMRMQGIVLLGAFLKLTPYQQESGMTEEQVSQGVEKALRKYFGKRGDQVVKDNLACVMRGYRDMREIPRSLIETAH